MKDVHLWALLFTILVEALVGAYGYGMLRADVTTCQTVNGTQQGVIDAMTADRSRDESLSDIKQRLARIETKQDDQGKILTTLTERHR